MGIRTAGRPVSGIHRDSCHHFKDYTRYENLLKLQSVPLSAPFSPSADFSRKTGNRALRTLRKGSRMKPNCKDQLLLAAFPMAGFAFTADLVWATCTGDGITITDPTRAGGIARAGNSALGSLSRVKSLFPATITSTFS